MEISIDISGLGELQKQMEEAEKAMAAVDGKISTADFNPADPESVDRAVQEMKAAVDAKMEPYRNNPFVEPFIEASKEAFEESIREKANTLPPL